MLAETVRRRKKVCLEHQILFAISIANHYHYDLFNVWLQPQASF